MYPLTLPTNLPDGTLDMVAKCYDDLGLETSSDMVTVTKGNCNSAETCHCATGQKYENSRCFWDAPTGELGADCSYPQFCKSGICTETDQGNYCSQDCIVGSTDACPMDFECVQTGASTGQCLPTSKGGCCSANATSNQIWAQIGMAGLVLGLVARRRRRRKAA
jgi:MYXO-CTERM domain-containing protein